jgi:hypothetical protein
MGNCHIASSESNLLNKDRLTGSEVLRAFSTRTVGYYSGMAMTAAEPSWQPGGVFRERANTISLSLCLIISVLYAKFVVAK